MLLLDWRGGYCSSRQAAKLLVSLTSFTIVRSHGMNAKPLIYSALIVAMVHGTGCQSWQGASFPMQNATRVPPPGTGTYALPSGYYNNTDTSSLSPTTVLPGTLTPGTLAPATQTMQANAHAAGSYQSANDATGGVVQAAFSSPPVQAQAVTDSHFIDADNAHGDGAISGLNDAPATETSNLQWQQSDGQ